jgi:hypothetical protein
VIFVKERVKNNMEERILKVLWNKSGSGSISPRLLIPIAWLRDMGVNENDLEIKAVYNEKTKKIELSK